VRREFLRFRSKPERYGMGRVSRATRRELGRSVAAETSFFFRIEWSAKGKKGAGMYSIPGSRIGAKGERDGGPTMTRGARWLSQRW
jgi:hypothetical protein